ncbi:MAG: deoxynucleoside kinase [Gammaproteobacteria bacterium]|nr:deoxynucleoside kinase [Gammaproteobacteria bacterium]
MTNHQSDDASDVPGYMAIEGPIGVGKTSLARRLADAFSCELILERPEDNPFLERFYQARKQYALPTQLSFLFQRVRILQSLRQRDMFSPVRVADFVLEKDPLFASSTLDDDELRLYQQVFAQMSPDVPVPDLVIYLQAPVDVLMERIRRRRIPYERSIEPEYLKELSDAYARMFYQYNASPLLIINVSQINFVERDRDFETLLNQIKQIRTGRHYFNPLASE